MWIGNYKPWKALFLKNEGILDKSTNWKSRKTGEKHAGRSILSYKLNLEAANLEQTHTQSQYCNPRAHARWALIIATSIWIYLSGKPSPSPTSVDPILLQVC